MKRFSEFIFEARTSQAAQKAHKLGYVGDGHGYWIDKQKKRVAKTVKGQLEFITGKKKGKGDGEEDQDNQDPSRGKPGKFKGQKPGRKRLGAKPAQAPVAKAKAPAAAPAPIAPRRKPNLKVGESIVIKPKSFKVWGQR